MTFAEFVYATPALFVFGLMNLWFAWFIHDKPGVTTEIAGLFATAVGTVFAGLGAFVCMVRFAKIIWSVE